MCGINGFMYEKTGSKEDNAKKISAMNSLITYRGPDGEGSFVDDSIAMGMRRLSIIDLCTGDQPIYNEDLSKVIVFNGEIYNYRELRKDLLEKGHKFRTQGDTEIIIHLYEEYKEKCLNLLNGMFAFAIYDIKEKSLFIARDRAGEKPLYYYKDDERLVFASELKSIIKVFDIKKEIDLTALNQYFSLTYIPAPLTIFKNIYKLEAGSFISYKAGKMELQRYWDVECNKESLLHDYSKCKKLLREYLFNSVEGKMISDVPLGAFLSGGIDSSIIVGIMSKLSLKPVETFTIGFNSREFDESSKARIVSEKNGTNHHVHYLDYEAAAEELDSILSTFDEPFADSSAIPTYFVSKFASQHVKVVLTGDAGDELFAGYSKYMINHYSDMYKKIPRILRKNVLEKLVYSMPDKGALQRKVRKVIENSEADPFEKRRNLMYLGFKNSNRVELLTSDYNENNSCAFIKNIYDKYNEADELTRTLYMDFKVVLEGDMLTKVDRMSMLESIETRVPLLDKNVIEHAFNIPTEYKIMGRSQKHILKDTFSDLLPPEILKKGKQGFAVPIGEWFKGPLKSSLLKLLSMEFIAEQGIFDYNYIQRLIDEHMTERVNHSYPLWTLYVFQNWYKKYFSD